MANTQQHVILVKPPFQGRKHGTVRSRGRDLVARREKPPCPDQRVGAEFHTDLSFAYETDNRRRSVDIHVLREQLAVGLLLDDRCIEIFEQALNADLLVIGIGIDCPELLCNLDQFPLEECCPFQRKAQDTRHMCGVKREEEIPDIGSTDG